MAPFGEVLSALESARQASWAERSPHNPSGMGSTRGHRGNSGQGGLPNSHSQPIYVPGKYSVSSSPHFSSLYNIFQLCVSVYVFEYICMYIIDIFAVFLSFQCLIFFSLSILLCIFFCSRWFRLLVFIGALTISLFFSFFFLLRVTFRTHPGDLCGQRPPSLTKVKRKQKV